MSKKPAYVKCPRCELNYIDRKSKLCNICKAEMSQPNSFYNSADDTEDNLLELCPVCKSSYITLDDDMCEKCRAKALSEATEEEDEDWRTFLDDETEDVSITTEDGVEISLSQLEEEELEKDFDEDEDFFEEEEEEFEDEDDFEDDFKDDFEDLDEDEDEDEDFEDEDDE